MPVSAIPISWNLEVSEEASLLSPFVLVCVIVGAKADSSVARDTDPCDVFIESEVIPVELAIASMEVSVISEMISLVLRFIVLSSFVSFSGKEEI